MELLLTPTLCTEHKDIDREGNVKKNEAGEEILIPPRFSGQITIQLPTAPESLRFKAKYGKRMKAKGVSEDIDEQNLEGLELLADVIDDIKKFIMKVDVTEVAGEKKKLSTLDDFLCYEPALPMLSEIALKFVTGFATKN